LHSEHGKKDIDTHELTVESRSTKTSEDWIFNANW